MLFFQQPQAVSQEFVAFTAYASENATYFDDGEQIIFDSVLTNIGDAFDPATSLFTCPFDGLYVFYAALTSEHRFFGVADIFLGDEYLVTVWADRWQERQGENMVVTECTASTQVGLRLHEIRNESRVFSDEDLRMATFSGFYLGETQLLDSGKNSLNLH